MLWEDFQLIEVLTGLGVLSVPVAYAFEMVEDGHERQLDHSRHTCDWCSRSRCVSGEVHVEADVSEGADGGAGLYEAVEQLSRMAGFRPNASRVHVQLRLVRSDVESGEDNGETGER